MQTVVTEEDAYRRVIARAGEYKRVMGRRFLRFFLLTYAVIGVIMAICLLREDLILLTLPLMFLFLFLFTRLLASIFDYFALRKMAQGRYPMEKLPAENSWCAVLTRMEKLMSKQR